MSVVCLWDPGGPLRESKIIMGGNSDIACAVDDAF